MSCIYCCCLAPSKSYKNFLCCFPLATATLLLSILFGLWGSWEIVYSVKNAYFPDYVTVCTLIVGCIHAAFALFGLLAIIFRSPLFMGIVKAIFEFIIALLVVAFIYQWVIWGLMLGGVITPNNEKWEPDGADIATMIIFSSITLLIIIAGYWILGLLGSLQKVYSVGGNGWEGKNYEEISQSNHSSNV